ncbi:MAG TPA: hypothetical protein ENK25_01840 [Bacteroidetes bacterium]|nr:hypothetical protein [Bacteroidota bacterium]
MKTGLFIVLLLCFNICLGFSLRGQHSPPHDTPKVGLVLSGGGAKGFAHLGAMKVLQKEGIPFDIIGGTSMGAIVGGLVASGIPVDTLINLIRRQDWGYLLSDFIKREYLSITEKKDRDRFMLSFPVSKKGITLPAGIIRGQHIENLLHTLTAPVYEIRDFNKLPIQFLCVALDIDNNKEIVFHHGDLADAMRASMSIPSVFEPIVINGNRMVDGGVVDNFPVRNVLDAGADIIIGIDVGHQKKNPEYKPNLVSVMEDAVFYYASMVRQESLKKVDLYIHPDLKGLGISNFTDFDSLIAYGEEAARAKLPEIRRLADSLYRLGRHVQKRHSDRPDSIYVKSIKMDGLKQLSKRLVNSSLNFHAMQWVKPSDLQKGAENFYASNYFEKVTFSLVPEGDGAQVIFHFREKEGNRFNVGFYYDSDYKTVFSLNTTFLNIPIKGSKLSMTGELGKNPGLDINYFLDKGAVMAPGFEISGNFLEAYNYDVARNRTASYTYFISYLRMFLQSRFNNLVLFRLGGEMNHTAIQPRISEINFGTVRDNFWGIFADINMDTRNRPVFPTTGVRLRGVGKVSSNRYFHPVNYLNLEFQKPLSFSNHFSMVNEIFGGITSGDSIPFQYLYWIGGQTDFTNYGNVPFPGYKLLEISSKSLFFYRMDLQYKLIKNLFIGLNGNIGTTATNIPDVLNNRYMITGVEISLGYLTPIGPIKVSLSKAGEISGAVGYFQIGFAF